MQKPTGFFSDFNANGNYRLLMNYVKAFLKKVTSLLEDNTSLFYIIAMQKPTGFFSDFNANGNYRLLMNYVKAFLKKVTSLLEDLSNSSLYKLINIANMIIVSTMCFFFYFLFFCYLFTCIIVTDTLKLMCMLCSICIFVILCN